MTTPLLPEGWRNWPESALNELLTGLKTLAQEKEAGRGPWLCDRPDCDGQPHKGRRNAHARAEQRPPADDEWDNWLLLAGRGFGKTRTGAEWVIDQARTYPRGALVGATAADTRDILVEGESGILACAPVTFRPQYEPSKRKLTYPNGAIQMCYSAEEPDRLRGPQHHYAWCIAAGEPVLTEHGWTPVQDVREGERVATRRGWLPSTGAVLTKSGADLVEIVTESGERVSCTPDHRIATGPTTWTEARSLMAGDTIVVWNSSMDPAHRPHGSNGVADVTTHRSKATTVTAGDGCCTGMCGLQPMEISPQDTSSITLTTTRRTTNSATYNASLMGSTSGIMLSTGMRPACMTTSIGPPIPRQDGLSGNRGMLCAPTVASLTSPQECGQSTVPPSVRLARVVSVSKLRRRADVYDIGVPGGGEFVAGGIVVHNCDELAAWKRLAYAWDMLMMGMRLGDHPRICITTTPRPLPLVKALVKDDRSAVVRGSTYDNLHNLAPTFRRAVLDRYAGTTLGRQELDAEILEDLPGALVARRFIEENRVDVAPELDLIVVAVDPAGTGTGDEAGILVVGRGAFDSHAYVIADYSGLLTAQQTGDKAWAALEEHGAAYIVYEDNFGKQWLRDGLLDAYRRRMDSGETAGEEGTRRLRKVHAQHGKELRAQPVAMRYEQGKVHHVGVLGQLEDSLTTWNPHESRDSPDRIDALVHGVTDLLNREKSSATMASPHTLGIERARGPVVHPLMRGRQGR